MTVPEKNTSPQEKTSPAIEKKGGGFVARLWNLLTSARLAVVLLLFISIVALSGAFIPQHPTAEKLESISNALGSRPTEIINRLDFFDIYHSLWFQIPWGLLCVSLFICSIDRLPDTLRLMKLRNAILPAGDPERLRINHKFYLKIPQQTSVAIVGKLLKSKGIKADEAARGDNIFFHINTGAIFRLASYGVHTSVILIIIGSIIGGFFGLRGKLYIDEGETANSFLRTDRPMGLQPLGFEISCDDFSCDYDPETGMAANFQSRLSILAPDGAAERIDLKVNHPGHYRGLGFYQTGYRLIGVDAAIIGVISPEGRKLGEAKVPLGEKFAELPGGGIMRLVSAKWDPQTNVANKIIVEIDTLDTGKTIMQIRRGAKAVPVGGLFQVEIAAINPADDSEAARFSLSEGEEKSIEDGVKIKLMNYFPEYPIQGREESAARLMISIGDETREHILLESNPKYDKPNIQGKYYFAAGDVDLIGNAEKYEGPAYELAGTEGRYKSVIDINRDPGVYLIYIGFVLMIASVFCAFFGSHRKIWIKIEPGRLSMGGTANRNEERFEIYFRRMAKSIEKALTEKPERRKAKGERLKDEG